MRNSAAGLKNAKPQCLFDSFGDIVKQAIGKKAANPVDKHVGSRVRMRWLMLGMSQTKLADGLALTKAFTRIKGPKLKRRIVDLVEEIMEDDLR